METEGQGVASLDIAELLPADRAKQTTRRKAIYEDLYPQAKRGGAPGLPGGGKAKVDNLSSFAEATAAITGHDARTVRRDAERGEKIADDVLAFMQVPGRHEDV
ncbi:hypothetical protein [Mesorhizobium sp. CN2-181]|uniref:hypothetical protein n=1 Tax=Mesorhizobium yinganensis TaxID=3157707 RepID=UPI0032B84A8A